MTTETEPAKFAVAVIVLRHIPGRRAFAWECIQVARKDDHSRWSLPGGKVDPGETSLQAAAREFAEETGIDLMPRGLDLMALHRFIPQETVLDSGGYFTTFYLLDTTGLDLPDTFEPREGEAPVRWALPEELFDGPYGRENRERFKALGIPR